MFRLIEGIIDSVLKGFNGSENKTLRTDSDGVLLVSTISLKPRPYVYFSEEVSPILNKLYDFGQVYKDVHIEIDKPIKIRFNSLDNPEIHIDSGTWDFINQFADKAYISFDETTNIVLYVNS